MITVLQFIVGLENSFASAFPPPPSKINHSLRGVLRVSLLAEALFLVFAYGRSLFSRKRTPGKEPLLAGKLRVCLRPIYTVRLCSIRQAYDRPTT